jgi:hypothetical protein
MLNLQTYSGVDYGRLKHTRERGAVRINSDCVRRGGAKSSEFEL